MSNFVRLPTLPDMTSETPPPPYGLDNHSIQAAASLLGLGLMATGAASLQSRRMILRPWAMADSVDLLALDADARVNSHLIDVGVRNRNEALAFMALANALGAQGRGLGVWRAGGRDDDRFLGYFLLAPDARGRIELGARLMPSAWGRGYALEGGRLLSAHAIETLKLPEIWGFCHPGNRAVPVLLQRLHFNPLGETVHLGKKSLAFLLDGNAWRAHGQPATARTVVEHVRRQASTRP